MNTSVPVTLNLHTCRCRDDLFRRLRETFDFPDYCGENWDAVWDCLTDTFSGDRERLILVCGADAVPEELQRDFRLLRRILDDLQEECPCVRVEYC